MEDMDKKEEIKKLYEILGKIDGKITNHLICLNVDLMVFEFDENGGAPNFLGKPKKKDEKKLFLETLSDMKKHIFALERQFNIQREAIAEIKRLTSDFIPQ